MWGENLSMIYGGFLRLLHLSLSLETKKFALQHLYLLLTRRDLSTSYFFEFHAYYVRYWWLFVDWRNWAQLAFSKINTKYDIILTWRQVGQIWRTYFFLYKETYTTKDTTNPRKGWQWKYKPTQGLALGFEPETIGATSGGSTTSLQAAPGKHTLNKIIPAVKLFPWFYETGIRY